MTRGVFAESTTTAADTAHAPAFSPGQSLLGGRYRCERFLGRGQMGVVLLATHVALGHPVAVKVRARSGEAARQRFRQEALVAVRVDHPHLVRLLDFGSEGDDDFLVMEYVDGSGLDGVLAGTGGTLSGSAAVRVARDVLDGLSALHDRGIVHRDVKPANVLVRRSDTRVKLADFGLAAEAAELAAGPATMAGSAAYMPPEVWRGLPAGPPGDVFAAGVLLFECLTGRRPWKGEDAAEVAWRIRDTDPTSLADLLPAAGSALRDFVARLIDKDPGRRPPADQATRAAEALLAADNRPLPSRLVQNRLALVLADGDLANLLTAVLASESVLAPLVAVTHPADARLRGLLPELDAILLDPTCAPPKEVAAFVGEVRVRFPWVVFFLVVDKARRKDVLVGFEPEWRERLGHYFLFSPDRPVRELPVAVRGLAAKIYGDRAVGRSSPPPAE